MPPILPYTVIFAVACGDAASGKLLNVRPEPISIMRDYAVSSAMTPRVRLSEGEQNKKTSDENKKKPLSCCNAKVDLCCE